VAVSFTLPTIGPEDRTPLVEALLAIINQQAVIIEQQQAVIAHHETVIAQQEVVIAQLTAKVTQLEEQVHWLKEQNQGLKDEIARLKGQKPKPQIKPSALDKNTPPAGESEASDGKRPGSSKRHKTKDLEIHQTVPVAPTNIPKGSRLLGHDDFVVQDIVIKPHNTKYQIERWLTPDGKTIRGALPEGLDGGHFGPMLVCFILYQYYHGRVTQPLLWEQLIEFGIDISIGQVCRIITEGKERFHQEKDHILKVGLRVARHLNVDDTGARHQGKNGYCTHIGNDLFAWFESTSSKSRINFLSLLRGGETDYIINEDTLAYYAGEKLAQDVCRKLASQNGCIYPDEAAWLGALQQMGITAERHIRIATEGALLGSVIDHGIHPDMVIISDDAGQFNVLLHALCWVHAERTIHKLVGFNDDQRAALERKRTEIWDYYAELKAYKLAPSEEKKAALAELFDRIFTEKTCFVSLNLALVRLFKNKAELLLVLDRPDIPLHTNGSERDIRGYVQVRKISGSTRSDLGRRCRDTFASLKKTCRKLGVSFWRYLQDRISGSHTVPSLAELIAQHAQEANA
jgi:hypothetical protein